MNPVPINFIQDEWDSEAGYTPYIVDNGVTMHREETLFRVKDALESLGYNHVQITDIINVIMNHGVLFREPIPDTGDNNHDQQH